MAIRKEKFFEIINEISSDEDLNEDSLLEKIKQQLLKRKYEEEHNKFHLDLNKNHQFSIGILSKKEDWMLLHIAAACNNLLIVELLLKKKVSINARVRDGSNDGATALHIAALCGHRDVIELLLSDDRIDPSLKSRNKTAKDMVGDVQDRNTVIEILEAAEENYRMKPKSKAKDLSIKVTGGRYHLLQDSHGIMAKTVKTSTNVINSYLEQHDTTQETSIANENVENEQYSRISVKNMVKEFESLKKENNGIRQSRETEQQLVDSQDHIEQEYLHDQHLEQHKASLDLTTDVGSSNDSGVGTPSEEEISLEDVNAQDENGYTLLHYATLNNDKELVKHLIESGADVNVQDEKGRTSLHYAVIYNNEELVKSLVKYRANVDIQDGTKRTPLYCAVANDNKKLAKHLMKHGADRSLIKDEDLTARLDSYVNSHSQKNDVMKIQGKIEKVKKPQVKLKKSCAQFEGKQKELKQQMQELENQKKLTETYKTSLEKTQKEIAELKNCIRHEEALNEENESLKQKIKSLESQRPFNSELNKTKISEMPLERAGLCFFKAASINFVTTLAILSIVSNLPILSTIAASVISALIAGGITYVIKPMTRLKEVDISKIVLDNKVYK